MAFRLQSALAGAAKSASAKIKAFDEDYADTLKNSAANLAKEAAQIRKDRMAAVKDYQKFGKRLQTNYKLSDAQIQTLLAGGVDQYEDFVNSIKNQEQVHILSNAPGEFDAAAAAAAMFSGTIAQPESILSVADQARAYAIEQVPSTLDLEATAAGVAAGTRRGIFGVDEATAKAALQRSAGEFADLDTAGPVISDTGLTIKGIGGMTADEIIAARTAQAELAGIEAKTKEVETQTQLVEQKVEAAEITNKQLPEQLQAELENTNASIALSKAREAGVRQDTKVAIVNENMLNEELQNYKKYGADKEQMAIDLLEAKIFAANSPADLEQLQAIYLRDETAARTEAASLDDADPKKNQLIASANILKNRAAGVANMIKDADATVQVDWSKGDPTSRFNAMLKTNLQNQNITGTLNAAGNYVFDFMDKQPAYITGYANTVSQYKSMYGKSGMLGINSSAQNEIQLANQIERWSQEGSFVKPNMEDKNKDGIPDARLATSDVPSVNFNFGLKTASELGKLQISGKLMPGDIATFEMKDDTGNKIKRIAMYSTQGEWISGDF